MKRALVEKRNLRASGVCSEARRAAGDADARWWPPGVEGSLDWTAARGSDSVLLRMRAVWLGGCR